MTNPHQAATSLLAVDELDAAEETAAQASMLRDLVGQYQTSGRRAA